MPQVAEQKVRLTPRVSINKLAEYLGSNKPLRRRAILMEQKFPADYITTRYKEALDLIVDFFVDADHDDEPIHQAIKRIQARPALNANQLTTRNVNIQVLKHLLKSKDKLPLANYVFRRASEQSALLRIGGVDISVRPELEIVATERGGTVSYGLLKLYLGKTYPLDETTAAYVATTVHQYGETHLVPPSSVCQKHCYVFDVFQERIYAAPKNFKQRRGDVEADCEEISAQWSSLS